MSGVATDEERRKRARHPVLLGIGIGGYVLGAMAGLFLPRRRRRRSCVLPCARTPAAGAVT
ncbi:hypothetical protein GCM10020227_25840 [Streptomyces flavovirens]